MRKGNIYIANPKLLEEKIKKIKKDSNENFHVISDFDRTLTPAFIDGKKAETGIGQIRAGSYLSSDYVKEAYALYDKYHPIEIDEDIPIEVRSKKMLKWWQTHFELMVKHGLNRGIINDIINKRNIKPRPASLEFYNLLHKYNVPLLIFSAGVGNLIEGFLKKEGKLYNNIHIISNFFEYDKDGAVCAYRSDIIHTFNKNEGQIKKTAYYEQVKKRRNVLLLGDSIGDCNMTEGLEHDTILRIGFLNINVEKLLPKYSKLYDVVLLNDCSMDYVNDLLRRILSAQNNRNITDF